MIRLNLLEGVKIKENPLYNIWHEREDIFKNYNFDIPFYMRTYKEETKTEPILTTEPAEIFRAKEEVIINNGKYELHRENNIKLLWEYIIKSCNSLPLKTKNGWIFHSFNTPELIDIALKYPNNSQINDEDYNLILKDMASSGRIIEIPEKKTYSVQREIKLSIPHLSNLSKPDQCMFIKQFLLSLSNIEDYREVIIYENKKIGGIEFILGKNSYGNLIFLSAKDISNKFDPNFLYSDNGFHMNINSDGNNLLLNYSSPEYKTMDRLEGGEGIISFDLNLIFKNFDCAMKNSKTHGGFLLNLYKSFDKKDYNIPLVNMNHIFDTDYRAKLIKEKKKNSDYHKRRIEKVKRNLLNCL